MRALSSRWRQTQKKGKPTAGLDQTVLPFSSPHGLHTFSLSKKLDSTNLPTLLTRSREKRTISHFMLVSKGRKEGTFLVFLSLAKRPIKQAFHHQSKLWLVSKKANNFMTNQTVTCFNSQQPVAENTPSMTPPTTPRLFTTYEQV